MHLYLSAPLQMGTFLPVSGITDDQGLQLHTTYGLALNLFNFYPQTCHFLLSTLQTQIFKHSLHQGQLPRPLKSEYSREVTSIGRCLSLFSIISLF